MKGVVGGDCSNWCNCGSRREFEEDDDDEEVSELDDDEPALLAAYIESDERNGRGGSEMRWSDKAPEENWQGIMKEKRRSFCSSGIRSAARWASKWETMQVRRSIESILSD